MFVATTAVLASAQAPTEVIARFESPSPKICWFGPSRANALPTRGTFTGGPILVVPLPTQYSPTTEIFYTYDGATNRLATVSYRELMVLDGNYRPSFNRVGYLDFRVEGAKGGETVYLTDSTRTERIYRLPTNGASVRTLGLHDGEVDAVVVDAGGKRVLETFFTVDLERSSPIPTVILRSPESFSWWWLALFPAVAVVALLVWARRPRSRLEPAEQASSSIRDRLS